LAFFNITKPTAQTTNQSQIKRKSIANQPQIKRKPTLQ